MRFRPSGPAYAALSVLQGCRIEGLMSRYKSSLSISSRMLCFAGALLAGASAAEGAGASQETSQIHWGEDLTPVPPRRPDSLNSNLQRNQQAAAPLPPSRPSELTRIQPAPQRLNLPTPPPRPVELRAPVAKSKAAPASAKEASPVKTPEPPHSGDCAAGKKLKKEWAESLDQAIAKLNGRMLSLKAQSIALARNLEGMLNRSSCMAKDFATGGMAQSQLVAGLRNPDDTGYTAAQEARKMPEDADRGFLSEGRKYEGVHALISELESAKRKLASLDMCKIDICNGGLDAIVDTIKPIPVKLTEVKQALAELQKGVETANSKVGPKEQQQLWEYVVGATCAKNGMKANVAGGIAGWRDVKTSFDALQDEIEKHATVLRPEVLAKVNVKSCSSLASGH
jgi:hypothetical protein